MSVGDDGMAFEWLEHWARIPETPSGRANGRTHGVCALRDGRIVVFHQAENALLTFDPDGKLMSAVGGRRWLGAHGLTYVREAEQEYFWLTDQTSTEVVKVTPSGETVLTIARAPHAAYAGEGRYSPTWAASHPVTGEIWVADGYGSSLVHRYDAKGQYVMTLDGTEGAGRFNCPHGLNFRTTPGGPELWITDRGNRRIVIYNDQGGFVRQSTLTHSPCAFDFQNGRVLIPELMTGVKLLDAASLAPVAEFGVAAWVGDGTPPPGWPDLAGTPHVHPGAFNSPHGACFTPEGDIVVVEWMIGGRITRLRRRR